MYLKCGFKYVTIIFSKKIYMEAVCKMDIFVEHMVKRKKTIMDYIKVLAVLIGGLFLVLIVPLIMGAIPSLGSLSLVVVVLIVYLMYKLVTSINVEYEYILTNSEMDVDKIINLRLRKKMAEVNFHKIDFFGKISSAEYNKYLRDNSIKKIFACKDIKDAESYFVVYESDDNGKMMLIFSPSEKMIKNISIINPQKCIVG